MRQGLWACVSAAVLLPSLVLAGTDGPDDALLLASAREFIALLAAGDYEAAAGSYDEKMAAALPPEKLREAWENLQKKAGAYQDQLTSRVASAAGYKVALVTCRFEKALVEVKVVFDERARVTGLWFGLGGAESASGPPPYADPNSFTETVVVVGSGEWSLPGTLTMPGGDGPFPGVVLVHGSGPQDRDETIGPNKPFRDLAWGLASQGVAVLRYEKRTKAHTQEMIALPDMTVKEETVDDALAAVALLKGTPGIRPDRVFVLGHSLGGMLAPRIAQAAPEIAGLIVMAGTSRPLEDVVLAQVRYITSLAGPLDARQQEHIAQLEAEVARVKALEPQDAAALKTPVLGAPASYWLDLRGYDPPAEAAKLKAPMLILQAGRDYQVTQEDLARWKKALEGRPDIEFKVYPDLNHLFIAGSGQITPAEYMEAGNVSRSVVDDVARWIKAH